MSNHSEFSPLSPNERQDEKSIWVIGGTLLLFVAAAEDIDCQAKPMLWR
jgi:hypothetical protein